jgi:hypothetical protein
VDIPAWLPNWREQSEYPSPSGTSRLEWAWQFLRRNAEYQQAWEQHTPPHYDPSDLSEAIDSKSSRMPLRRLGRPQLEETRVFQEQFRIGTYPPPAPSEPTAKLGFVAIRYAEIRGEYTPRIPLGDDQLLVLFHLNLSIERQVADARKLLTSLRRGQFRASVDQYQRYLRLLDAKAVGASNADIAQVLYPGVKNIFPDYDAKNRIRKDMRIAKRLRDHDYWLIALGGE